MPFTRETALRARWRKGGLHRASYWRGEGWTNLRHARATHWIVMQRHLSNRQIDALAEATLKRDYQARPKATLEDLPVEFNTHVTIRLGRSEARPLSKPRDLVLRLKRRAR